MATLIAERSSYWVVSGGSNPYEDGDYRYYWQILYEQSDSDRLNNQSQLIIKYYIQKHKSTSVYGDVVSYPSGTSIVNIDGSEWGRFTTSSGSIVVGDQWALVYIGTKQKPISHTTDGSRSFTFQASGFGKGTATSTYTLPKIDRGSVLGSIGTFNVDEGVTVPVTKYVSSYYDVLTITCKNTNDLSNAKTIKTYNNFTNGTKVSFTDDELNTIYNHQSTGSSTIIGFELKTYTDSSKGTQIGSSSTKNVSASLTIINPTLNGYSYADINPKTLSLTGNNPLYIVKGLSTLQISIPKDIEAIANTRQATISYYLADDTKITYNSEGSIGTIPNYSKNYVSVKAVDSRTIASVEMITSFEDFGAFIDYTPIAKNDDYTYSRNNNGIGPQVTISFSGTWWQGNFGGTDNKLTASYKFKKSSANEYITGKTKLTLNTSDANKFSCEQLIAGDQDDNGFDVSESYDIIVTVGDSTGSHVEYVYSIHAGEPAIALYKNKASFGAAYDEQLGGTQLWGACYLNGDDISAKLYPVGSIYLSVNNTNPSVLFGGEWEQIKDTFLLSAGDTYEAGSTGGEATHTLTVAELPKDFPKQNKGIIYDSGETNSGWFAGEIKTYNSSNYKTQTGRGTQIFEELGNGQAHNNMPPYLTVYMWKRIK